MTEQISFERLTGIIAFSRAASLGSFTAAAKSLSISPSAVSKSIQRLELLLGVKLFTRTTRSLVLTPEGHELQDKALQLLQAAESVVQAATASQAEPSGTLKIAAPLPIGTRLLAPTLPGFRRRFPKVKLDLRLSDHFVNLVEERIDVAIRIGHLPDSNLISRTLAPVRLGAYASPAYLSERGIPQRPEEIADHDCVNFRYQNSGKLLSWAFAVGERAVELRPDAAIVVDVSDAVVELLAAGAGIGMAASWIAAPYVERHLLMPILEPYWVTSSAIHAVWPQSRQNNPAVKAFVAYLAEVASARDLG
ncbi:MAG TPA: LysR substrate-binding domain-containing protein [Ideonella sp.]|uniref:LysR family transcriptional regulator n=1 Tax=Ideonella sp. TaxID=1929293 RepID=UPI002CC2FC09|nr:LysR substrate-binding domain-containing protein [Ideonella sp.]HSI48663.1 LysR substrate-binding domain-containing protein [Ideonella sp.]